MTDTPKVGFGKHFESMYEGSMIRAGAMVFAVMGYVIAKMKPAGEIGQEVMIVELNPELLGFILGEDEGEVREAIAYLCKPDPKSRSKAEEGRRLVKEGEFAYRVVNGLKYRDKENRDPWKRKEQNREAQQRHRDRKKSKPLPLERQYLAAEKRGDQAEMDRIAAGGQVLPGETAVYGDGRELAGKWDWKQGKTAEAAPKAPENPSGSKADEAPDEDWSFGGKEAQG